MSSTKAKLCNWNSIQTWCKKTVRRVDKKSFETLGGNFNAHMLRNFPQSNCVRYAYLLYIYWTSIIHTSCTDIELKYAIICIHSAYILWSKRFENYEEKLIHVAQLSALKKSLSWPWICLFLWLLLVVLNNIFSLLAPPIS